MSLYIQATLHVSNFCEENVEGEECADWCLPASHEQAVGYPVKTTIITLIIYGYLVKHSIFHDGSAFMFLNCLTGYVIDSTVLTRFIYYHDVTSVKVL